MISVKLLEAGIFFGLHTEGCSVLVELPEVGVFFGVHTEGCSVLVELPEVGVLLDHMQSVLVNYY